MVIALTEFFLSSVVIVISGIFLTRNADKIAEATNMGRLLVGGIFLAGATSLPELFVDISAIRNNMPDLAVGDLMGSSLFNLLILAVADLIHRGENSFFSRAAVTHALSAAMSISVTALAGLFIFVGQQLAPYQIGELGIGTLSIFAAYTLGLRMVYVEQKFVITKDLDSSQTKKKSHLTRTVIFYLLSASVMLIAAPFLANAAGKIAELTGLGNTFVGTTLVAFCTSLPELVSTLAAVHLGAYDLALGNIFGSNAFNMILLTPLDLIYKGSLLAAVSRAHVISSFSTIVITAVAVMGQLYQVEKRKLLLEPDAILIMMLVFCSLLLLYFVK